MIREHPHGGALEVRVYAGRDPATGKERYLSKTIRGTGRQARADAKRLEADLTDQARAGREAPRDATIADALDRWLEVADIEPSTRRTVSYVIGKHLKPAFGAMRVRDLRPEKIDRVYAGWRKTYAPSSIARWHATLNAALNQAVKWGWLTENPCSSARPISVGNAQPQPPHPNIVRALFDAADPDLRCFLRVSATTGMRRGEVCALRRSDLALDVGVIRKQHAIGRAAGGIYEKETKTGGRHPVAVDIGTCAELAEQLARTDERAAALDVELVADPYVFTYAPDGASPWTPDNVSRRVKKLCGKVPGAENVKLHDLRHFVATVLLALGHSPTTVAGRLGHARTSMTTDVYAAFLPTADRQAADQLGDLLTGSTGDRPRSLEAPVSTGTSRSNATPPGEPRPG